MSAPPAGHEGSPTTLTLPQAVQHAFAAYQRGEWAEAEGFCRRVLGAKADHFDALQLLGIIAAQTRRMPEAVELLSKAAVVRPDDAGIHYNRGNALLALTRFPEALQSFERALAIKPDFAEAANNRGNALRDLGRYAEALESYERALVLAPVAAEFHCNRGNALYQLERFAEALECFERALALRPDYAEAHDNRGTSLFELERFAEALESFERALAIRPGFAEAANNRGNALFELERFAEALESFERALALKPDYAEAYYNRGNALFELKRFAEALQSFDRALVIEPDHADACNNRGNALRELKRYPEALESYQRALRLEPDHEFLYGSWLHTRMQICDWQEFSGNRERLTEKILRSERASPPFPVLALSDSPAVQRRAAEIWVQDRYPAKRALPKIPTNESRDARIRIGYFSADFRDHPVSSLTAELFERHDRSKFEVIAFSYGMERDDDMRKRLIAAFDRFLDVRALSDDGAARLARELELDIAVDLGGFTAESRAGIFAMRAAPLQVSYLGYPGTMGAEFIDYLIADRTIVPEAQQRHYSEKIVYLPSYQAGDSRRRIADKSFGRAELGLPRAGFVFCCFNNDYKITPDTFDRWMAILRTVGNSVLFLYAENEWVEPNLKREAAARGVDPGRLAFGARLPMAEYLARYRVADLFLDTYPYNAGATANDALWAGLPVLTCLGETFAGRMGASLLRASGLPELITETPEQYERRAIELASDPDQLSGIRRKLAEHRLTIPLFDMQRHARHLEDAYTKMFGRYRAGFPPEILYVEA